MDAAGSRSLPSPPVIRPPSVGPDARLIQSWPPRQRGRRALLSPNRVNGDFISLPCSGRRKRGKPLRLYRERATKWRALCGAPWRQPRNPPRDIGPEILVLRPKTLREHGLLVRHNKGVEGEPHEPAINHQTPVAEQDRLAQNDGDKGNVNRIANVAIETRHHEVLCRCDRRRRAQSLQRKAHKRVNKPW